MIADFGALAQSAVGVPQDTFAAGLKDRSNDLATRVSWKYACSRAVAGTPTYFINGVPTQVRPCPLLSPHPAASPRAPVHVRRRARRGRWRTGGS